jgi:hypothetical protein
LDAAVEAGAVLRHRAARMLLYVLFKRKVPYWKQSNSG